MLQQARYDNKVVSKRLWHSTADCMAVFLDVSLAFNVVHIEIFCKPNLLKTSPYHRGRQLTHAKGNWSIVCIVGINEVILWQ